MSTGSAARPPGRRPRQELIMVLLLGAAGAGLVLLAMRQGWARIEVTAPRPLPASVTTVTGQALVPAASALAVAGLAGLAAVLATRRTLRRIAGVVLAGFGAGIVAVVLGGIGAADVLAAGAAGVGGQPGSGTSGAGSTTGSTAGGAGGTPLSGFPGHVAFVSYPWRGVAVLGALGVVAAGALVAWRAERLPVMSGRFERPSRPVTSQPAVPAGGRARGAADSASLWESLSRGEDPTAGD